MTGSEALNYLIYHFFQKGKSFSNGLPFFNQEIKSFDKSEIREVISMYQYLDNI